MKANIKKLWIAALRSGDYTQSTGRLRRLSRAGESRKEDKFSHCCLGVLGELYCEATNQPWNSREVGDGQSLSRAVLTWSGMRCGMGDSVHIDSDILYPLAALNDGGKNFAQIADAIESQL